MFIADYVLMGYGTGAIMAVPGQDTRDWDFATAFGLPIIRTVQPPADHPDDQPFTGDGPAINSANAEISLDGLGVAEAKAAIDRLAGGQGLRERREAVQAAGLAVLPAAVLGRAVPDRLRRGRGGDRAAGRSTAADPARGRGLLAAVVRPQDATSEPVPPLARATEWANVTLDLGDGPKSYRRELNVMPQWAGSCWYELRYLDPTNDKTFCDPGVEQYWMGKDPSRPNDTGGVDLYVGGVEHAVLHLLYSRFWHKALYDLGHVTSEEPFRRLFNQGYIQAYAYTDERGHLRARRRGRRARPRASSSSRAGRSPRSTGRWASR